MPAQAGPGVGQPMSKRQHIVVKFRGVEIDIVLANDFDPFLPSVAEMKLFARIAHLLVPALADVDSSLCAREPSAALTPTNRGRRNTGRRGSTIHRVHQKVDVRRKDLTGTKHR